MKVLNQTKNTTLVADATLADSFFSRMKGLLGRNSLPENEGLIITHCNSIHMFFMRFAIDVVFIDGDDTVVGIVENIPPFRLSRIFWKAKCAIEVPVGTIEKTQTGVGDKILIEK